ncbi:hypothetical protein HPP92_014100 [Vanilla planifolia]|uniref:Uncharacterized protein n=1 Tax=Vanilla planifolia TaxID=51239 RepID=A0A835QRA0_VANPL|nr:hypothetical protein HPP92_014100 [Vanilla planifolia]
MRLLELVSCGRPEATEEPSEPSFLPSTTDKRGQRRRSLGSTRAWRPSLGAIVEDTVLSVPSADSPHPPAKERKYRVMSAGRRTAPARLTAKKKCFSTGFEKRTTQRSWSWVIRLLDCS